MRSDFQKILNDLEFEIPCREMPDSPRILSADMWVLSSGLQKAVRRGDEDRAAAFARALWNQDRRMLWRRLHVIALEDVGAASPDVVVKVLTAYEASVWRREAGDKAVAIHLARLMAGAIKTQFSEQIYMFCEYSPDLAALRRRLLVASPARREKMALDPDVDISARALALWSSAGTRQFPAKLMPKQPGSLADAAETMQKLGAPVMLTEACIAVLSRTQWPLALFTPLAWTVFEKERSHLQVSELNLPASPEFEGIPAYALDGLYTRVGKSAIRQLKDDVEDLKKYTPQQIGLACFYSEGAALDRTLTSPFLSSFRRESILTVIADAGLRPDEYAELNATLQKRWKTYDQIRLHKLEFSLYGSQLDIFFRAR